MQKKRFAPQKFYIFTQRHYVKAFYISFVTLIKFLKERPIFHVEMCDKAPQKLVSSAAQMNGRQRTCTIFFVFEGQAAIMRCNRVKFSLINKYSILDFQSSKALWF